MEINTKERILQEALKLFSQNGYMATSMSDIAKRLNVSKAALYKHYKSKQEIFDSILKRMDEMDKERVEKYQMPEGIATEAAKKYKNTPVEKIVVYSEALFLHWTEEEFSKEFRKMLTLEQYRNDEMGALYQKYLGEGPIRYMTELFDEMQKDGELSLQNPKQIALDFYGPIYLLIGMYDAAEDKEEMLSLLKEHIYRFAKQQGFVETKTQ